MLRSPLLLCGCAHLEQEAESPRLQKQKNLCPNAVQFLVPQMPHTPVLAAHAAVKAENFSQLEAASRKVLLLLPQGSLQSQPGSVHSLTLGTRNLRDRSSAASQNEGRQGEVEVDTNFITVRGLETKIPALPGMV